MKTLARFALLAVLTWMILPVALAQPATAHYAGHYVLPSGGYLDVDAAGDALVVQAVGQDAVAALGAGAEDPAGLLAVSRRTDALLQALRRGDRGALRAAVDGHPRTDALRDMEQMLDVVEAAYGPMERTEVLGAEYGARGEARTFVRVGHDHGTATYRLVWRGDLLLAWIKQPDVAFRAYFQPVADGRFQMADGTGRGEPTMTFHTTRDGEVGHVVLTRGAERTRAARASAPVADAR